MQRKSVIYLLGLVLLISSTSFAIDLGISPLDVNLTLNRGDEYHGELYILGSDTETVEVNGYVNDWSMASNGGYQFLPMGTLKRSASPWITFTPKNFKLPPKRGQKISYTINVPSGVSGSYWSTIIFGSLEPMKPGKDQFQLRMAGQIAYIIRININGSPPGEGVIERFRFEWSQNLLNPVARLRVKNNGSSFIRFKGRLEIKDSQGKKVDIIPFKEGLVLPGYSREFTLADSNLKLAPGYYVGLAIADFGGRSLKAAQATIEIKK